MSAPHIPIPTETRVVQCPESPNALLPLGQFEFNLYYFLRFVGGEEASLELVGYSTEANKRGRFQVSPDLGVYFPSPAIKGVGISDRPTKEFIRQACRSVFKCKDAQSSSKRT